MGAFQAQRVPGPESLLHPPVPGQPWKELSTSVSWPQEAWENSILTHSRLRHQTLITTRIHYSQLYAMVHCARSSPVEARYSSTIRMHLQHHQCHHNQSMLQPSHALLLQHDSSATWCSAISGATRPATCTFHSLRTAELGCSIFVHMLPSSETLETAARSSRNRQLSFC